MEPEKKDYTSHILRTSGKTVLLFLAALLLIVVIVFSCAPTVAVDFYTGLGQENTAYHYMVKAGKKDAKWAYKAASKAIELDYADAEIAKQCKHFLSLDDGSVAQSVDDYNLSHSPAPSYDVVLYSVQNYFAEFVAKEQGEIFDGEAFVTPAQALTTDATVKNKASIANQLSLLTWEDNTGVAEFLLSLLSDVPTQNQLLSLYVLRAANRLSKAAEVDVSYQGQPIADAYQAAFDAYVK